MADTDTCCNVYWWYSADSTAEDGDYTYRTYKVCPCGSDSIDDGEKKDDKLAAIEHWMEQTGVKKHFCPDCGATLFSGCMECICGRKFYCVKHRRFTNKLAGILLEIWGILFFFTGMGFFGSGLGCTLLVMASCLTILGIILGRDEEVQNQLEIDEWMEIHEKITRKKERLEKMLE